MLIGPFNHQNSTCRQHYLVPLPLLHPLITMVKLDDRAEVEQKNALDKYHHSLNYRIGQLSGSPRTILQLG